MTRALTPYDTGKRAQPQVWVSPYGFRPVEHDEDRYGRVDFDDSEGSTIANVYVEGTEDGDDTMHITMGPGTPARIIIHTGGEDRPEIEYED